MGFAANQAVAGEMVNQATMLWEGLCDYMILLTQKYRPNQEYVRTMTGWVKTAAQQVLSEGEFQEQKWVTIHIEAYFGVFCLPEEATNCIC